MPRGSGAFLGVTRGAHRHAKLQFVTAECCSFLGRGLRHAAC